MLSNPTNIAFGGKDFDQLFAANLGGGTSHGSTCG
jgi:hypothetical protein